MSETIKERLKWRLEAAKNGLHDARKHLCYAVSYFDEDDEHAIDKDMIDSVEEQYDIVKSSIVEIEDIVEQLGEVPA